MIETLTADRSDEPFDVAILPRRAWCGRMVTDRPDDFGRHSIEEVVRETGFANREQLRRSFLRTFGQPPQALRRSARLQWTA